MENYFLLIIILSFIFCKHEILIQAHQATSTTLPSEVSPASLFPRLHDQNHQNQNNNSNSIKEEEEKEEDHAFRVTQSLQENGRHRRQLRKLDEQNDDDGDDDDNNDADDDGKNDDDADDAADAVAEYDDDEANENELCSQYLVQFLEGTTDAKDNCDGIMNAYVAAGCMHDINEKDDTNYYDEDDHDDYFGIFYESKCCASLKSHYNEYCEQEPWVTNGGMLILVCILLLGECAKSLIKATGIHFLPEAGGCILVGTFCGCLAHFLPFMDVDDISFDDEFFLIVLLPPIIFEAALSVNKKEFRRRRLAIFMFAVIGTILSSFMTGFIVYFASQATNSISLPLLDSLVFGTLISSIDPVAILSVLTSLNVSETDTIFILVFGESLLNDGVAITLFKALITCYDGKSINTDEILGALADFLIVAFGSIAIGIACGSLCMVYFWSCQKILHPVMEVGSFFLWALIPYYISDGLQLSGIVAIVVMGFIMDIYVCVPRTMTTRQSSTNFSPEHHHDTNNGYIDMDDTSSDPSSTTENLCRAPSFTGRGVSKFLDIDFPKLIFGSDSERVRLSQEADQHVRFVAHLLSSLSENAIFVYLGLFLLSSNYNWDITLVSIGIGSCILSRAVMVFIVTYSVWHIHVQWQKWNPTTTNTIPVTTRRRRRTTKTETPTSESAEENIINNITPSKNLRVSRTVEPLLDPKVQTVLVLAGLRGAVSLALVENVPIYNGVSMHGSHYKPLMKAMTSASILFTMFIFGGSAYYILRYLGVAGGGEGDRDGGGSESSSLTSVKEDDDGRRGRISGNDNGGGGYKGVTLSQNGNGIPTHVMERRNSIPQEVI